MARIIKNLDEEGYVESFTVKGSEEIVFLLNALETFEKEDPDTLTIWLKCGSHFTVKDYSGNMLKTLCEYYDDE